MLQMYEKMTEDAFSCSKQTKTTKGPGCQGVSTVVHAGCAFKPSTIDPHGVERGQMATQYSGSASFKEDETNEYWWYSTIHHTCT